MHSGEALIPLYFHTSIAYGIVWINMLLGHGKIL